MIKLADLRKNLQTEISQIFICRDHTRCIKRRESIFFDSDIYYAGGKFKIPFYTKIEDVENRKKKTVVHYVFIIENGKIIERLYNKGIWDEYNCFEEQKVYHIELVKSKEAEIIAFVNNYNTIRLLYDPSANDIQDFEKELMFTRAADYRDISGLWGEC